MHQLNGTHLPGYSRASSEEMSELLGKMPGWIVSWGISATVAITLLLVLAGSFIRYPETINTRVVVTTRLSPAPIITRENGRISFLIGNNKRVRKGDVLSVIENPAVTEDAFLLARLLGEFEKDYPHSIDRMKGWPDTLSLGELQNNYLNFLFSLSNEQLARRLTSYQQQIQALQNRRQKLGELQKQLLRQNNLLTAELALTEKDFARNQLLYAEKAISQVELERKEISLLQSRKTLELARSSLVENEIGVAELDARINDLGIEQRKEAFGNRQKIYDAFRQLKVALLAWKQKYVLTAPIDGVVTLTKYWNDAQFVPSNEEVLSVLPLDQKLHARLVLPIAGSGKVKTGQKVVMRFDNYPHLEFG